MTLTTVQSPEFRVKEQDFDFEKLTVYQRALDFVDHMYTLTKAFPAREGFTIVDQLRRAALSIPLNVAEGSGRSKREFRNFLRIARSSCYECIPLLELAARQQLLPRASQQRYYAECGQLTRMISGLFNSLDCANAS